MTNLQARLDAALAENARLRAVAEAARWVVKKTDDDTGEAG